MARADLEVVMARPEQTGRAQQRTIRVDTFDGATTIEFSTRGARAAFGRLVRRGGIPADLLQIAANDGAPAAAEWRAAQRRLETAGALAFVVRDGRTILMRAVPMRAAYHDSWKPVVPRGRLMLSRFAHLRRDGTQWLLESPRSFVRVEVAPEALPILAQLAKPVTAAALARRAGMPAGCCRAVVALLQAGGFLTRTTAAGIAAEDADTSLMQWEFADLLMLAHSRAGRHDRDFGGTFEFADRMPPEKLLKRPPRSRPIPLYRPPPRSSRDESDSFTDVLEQRRTIRTLGERPITIRALGEFLYRSARVRSIVAPTDKRPYAWTRRPYPSGGGCYPLELYVVSAACDGLDSAIYHYDPMRHVLRIVSRDAEAARSLVTAARAAQLESASGQVLIVYTARFRRLTWKYRSIALSTILKDVGALMQTMYLVATAMHLAPSAVGAGDSTRFGEATALRFEEESPVGEFLLGSRPD